MAIPRRSGTIVSMDEATAAMRVMIADDSRPVRERLASLICEIPGVAVVAETSDIPATLDGVRTLLPDIVILDINMPGGSGFDVLDRIRMEGLHTLVIVITTHEEREYEIKAMESGAAAFFNKSRDFIAAAELVREYARKGAQ